MRTPRALAILVAALTSFSCSSPFSGSGGSTPPLPSPTPSPVITSDSAAADLRTRLDLLLAEYVMVVTKESAAAAAHGDEYTGYASLLITNSNDLTELMRSAFGDAGATQFDQIWKAQNGYWIDYTVGLVTHNQSKSDGAGSGLINAFVPALAQFLTTMTRIPLDPTTQLLTEQVIEMRNVIDDQVAQSYVKMYADLSTAVAQTARLGSPVAARIVQKFPDKFPGDPTNKAAEVRINLDLLLQKHAYLASLVTDAGVAGRTTEHAAGLTALASDANSLGTVFAGLFGSPAGSQFDQIWAARDSALDAYAGPDAAARQSAQSSLNQAFVSQFSAFVESSTGLRAGAMSPLAGAQVKAAIQVIDDQRTKTYTQLAADDRTAATSMQTIGDAIATATVSKLPGKFI